MGRSVQRCKQCEAMVPDDAVYCPRCGAPTGTITLERVADDGVGPSNEVALGVGHRRRWVGIVVAAGIVAVVAGVAVVGGRGGGTTATPAPTTTAPTTTATTAPTSSTVPAPSITTTTVYSRVYDRPFVPGADGLIVYAGNGRGELARVDLGAGVIDRRVVAPRGSDIPGGPWAVLARRGGAAVFPSNGAVLSVLDGPGGLVGRLAEWKDGGDGGISVPQVAPAAEPDEVWIWHDTGTQTTSIERKRLDGAITAGPVDLPRYGHALGADGPGAVALSGPDGFYRAVIDGATLTVEHVWPRAPLAFSSTSLLDLVCTASLECRLELVDRASGTSRPVPTQPPDLFYPYSDSTLSPDGRWLAHTEYSGQSPRLVVYDLVNGGVAVDHPTRNGQLGQPAFGFSPDGHWLVFADLTGDINVWRAGSPDQPQVVNTPNLTDVASISVAP